MPSYRHTQRGTLIIVMMVAVSCGLGVLGWFLTPLALISIPILLIGGWLFHSLTVQVNDDTLEWWFGPRFLRKRERVSEIGKAELVRTNVLEGWGIHLSRFGWLYNVSGFDAVAITMKNGKRFALGTDEPAELLRAIEVARAR